MKHILFILFSLSQMLFLGCAEETTKPQSSKSEMPFARIAVGEENPADNGPDDSTVLDGVKGTMGEVKFSHFTHASNSKNGYGIPCISCHHNVVKNEDSSACKDCHLAPSDEDPAHAGPDDNMVLTSESSTVPPVPFNHFTHTSARGYKIACSTCHHKDSYLGKCSECHGTLATVEKDSVVPKTKRAFHLQCKGCHDALAMNNPLTKAPTTCESCHRGGMVSRMPGILSLERAYHLSCISCHTGVKAAAPDTKAPTSECSRCHPEGSPQIPEGPKEKSVATENKRINSVSPDQHKGDESQELDASPSPEPASDEKADSPKIDPKKGPVTISLAGSDDGKKTKPFAHAAHQDYADSCNNCHHKGMDKPSCMGSCHETTEAKKIFHKQCRDCHKENGVNDACGFCHI